MLNKKNLLIGGGILVGLYLLNPYSSSFRQSLDDAEFNYQSKHIKIVNFIGKIEYTPSDDQEFHIQVSNAKADNQPNFDHTGGNLEISNHASINKTSCSDWSWNLWGFWRDDEDDDFAIAVNGGSSRKFSTYPTLKIQAPTDVKLTIDKSIIYGRFSDVDSLDVNLISCSDLSFKNVKSDARLQIRSSGNINVATVGGTAISEIRGSGNLHINVVKQDSQTQIRGSGNVSINRLAGIHKMNILGSGNIDVGNIIGDAEILVQGSGDVDIADGDLNWLIAKVQGSGNIEYGGKANNFRPTISGSGDIDTKF